MYGLDWGKPYPFIRCGFSYHYKSYHDLIRSRRGRDAPPIVGGRESSHRHSHAYLLQDAPPTVGGRESSHRHSHAYLLQDAPPTVGGRESSHRHSHAYLLQDAPPTLGGRERAGQLALPFFYY